MRVLVRTVPWDQQRHEWAQELCVELGAELVEDTQHNAYETYLDALRAQGMDDAWHMEDDAVPTTQWHRKARWLLQSRPDTVIQGFSRRGADMTTGSRWQRSGFNYAICFFLPGRLAPQLLTYGEDWPKRRGTDMNLDGMTNEFLANHGERYWLAVPSLVQHRAAKSMIGGRSTGRQSPTFVP